MRKVYDKKLFKMSKEFSNICEYKEILNTILFDKTAPENVFSARVEQNTSGVIVFFWYILNNF